MRIGVSSSLMGLLGKGDIVSVATPAEPRGEKKKTLSCATFGR